LIVAMHACGKSAAAPTFMVAGKLPRIGSDAINAPRPMLEEGMLFHFSWVLLILILPLVLSGCGYTDTCTFDNRTSFRVNVFEAIAGDDGKPRRPPSIVTELAPLQTAQAACGVSAGDSDYSLYFEARAFSLPQNTPVLEGNDIIWRETVSQKELKKRNKWVVIEVGSGSQTATPGR
jgi:hypothetical protein